MLKKFAEIFAEISGRRKVTTMDAYHVKARYSTFFFQEDFIFYEAVQSELVIVCL